MEVYLHDDQDNGAAVMIKQTSAHVIPLPYEVSYEEVGYEDDECNGDARPQARPSPTPGPKQARRPPKPQPSQPKTKKQAPRSDKPLIGHLQNEIAQMQTKLEMMAIVVDTLQTRERARDAEQRKPATRG